MTSRAIRILGIDPGLRRTGWGVIDVDGNRLIYVGCGSVESRDTLSLSERLLAIHEGLGRVLGDFRPAEEAVENTFVIKDGASKLNLGHSRGVGRCFRFRRIVEDLEMLGLKDLPVEPVVLDLILAEVALRVGL